MFVDSFMFLKALVIVEQVVYANVLAPLMLKLV